MMKLLFFFIIFVANSVLIYVITQLLSSIPHVYGSLIFHLSSWQSPDSWVSSKNIFFQYIYIHHLFIKVRWMWYQSQKNYCFYCIVQSDMLHCCRQQLSHHHRRSHHHRCVARRSCRTHKNLMHASK